MDVRWPFVSAHTVQCSWGNVWRLDDARWLTDLSWQNVVGSQLSGSTQRRWLCFDGEAVAVQTWRLLSINGCKRAVADTVVVSQEMPRSATPYTSLISFRPQSNSDWLCGEVKSLIYHILVILTFTSSKNRSLASCWVVGLDDVMDSSGLWLAGRINVYEMRTRFSRDEINDYYSIYTMTTSPYLYITTIHSYWRTSPWLHNLYNIQLQHFRAKFFYIVISGQAEIQWPKCM